MRKEATNPCYIGTGTVKLGDKELFGHRKIVHYLWCKLAIYSCSLSSSFTVLLLRNIFYILRLCHTFDNFLHNMGKRYQCPKFYYIDLWKLKFKCFKLYLLQVGLGNFWFQHILKITILVWYKVLSSSNSYLWLAVLENTFKLQGKLHSLWFYKDHSKIFSIGGNEFVKSSK